MLPIFNPFAFQKIALDTAQALTQEAFRFSQAVAQAQGESLQTMQEAYLEAITPVKPLPEYEVEGNIFSPVAWKTPEQSKM